ncbi:MAG: hypothetical protein AAFR66_02255 [Bacteroidota bacterium]
MSKKFTTKKLKLRSRAEKRRWSLKTNPRIKGFKASIEQQNLDVIRSLEEKVKAATK